MARSDGCFHVAQPLSIKAIQDMVNAFILILLTLLSMVNNRYIISKFKADYRKKAVPIISDKAMEHLGNR